MSAAEAWSATLLRRVSVAEAESSGAAPAATAEGEWDPELEGRKWEQEEVMRGRIACAERRGWHREELPNVAEEH